MKPLPESLGRYLLETALADRHCAFVRLDADGRAEDLGGDLAWYGLEFLEPGDPVGEHFAVLQHGSEHAFPEVLPRIELAPGRATDVHFVPDGERTTLLLLDVTEEAAREQHLQQRGNEWSLALRAWGVAVFEEIEPGRFRSLGLVPSWMTALRLEPDDVEHLTERFPLLEVFMEDAHATWEHRGPPVAWSDVWVEEDASGKEWYLEANATTLEDGRRLLLVHSVNRRLQEHLHILQEARSRNLDLHRLRREIDRKEVLLHCIVHDLKGPLAAMIGSMSLLEKPGLAEERRAELLRLGLDRAHHQEAMIRGILEAFVADVEALESFDSDPRTAPGLVECVERSIQTYAGAYEREGVELELATGAEIGAECKVCGDGARLERVLGNLLENALRHSPRGSRTRVRLEDAQEDVRVVVEDEGPGVAQAAQGRLFEQRFRAGEGSGASGLGLWFCRTTVEKWGGAIGYEAREEGGARFWVRLVKAARP